MRMDRRLPIRSGRSTAASSTRTGPLPTLIEWDNDVPQWPVLLAQARRADAILGTNRKGAGPVNTAFAAALLDPDIAIPAAVTGPDGGPATRRYSVYRNNVVVGLMEALRGAFPPCWRSWVKKISCVSPAISWLIHPPRSPMMQRYGEAIRGIPRRFFAAALRALSGGRSPCRAGLHRCISRGGCGLSFD